MSDVAAVRSGLRFAVLIDADNAQAEVVEAVLREVGKLGNPSIRRVYGNWTGTHLQPWKAPLHEHALQPVQQFALVPGKNSTDSAMIIDAMDILHTQPVDGFAIVSSDSDYTRLATRLRESGKFVLGVGTRQTPKPLVRACNQFVYTENLAKGRVQPARAAGGGRGQPRRKDESPPPAELRDLLREAVDATVQEDGWSPLSGVGSLLSVNDPDFDPRSYGRRRLVDLFAMFPDTFEVRRPDRSEMGLVYVRTLD